MKLYAQPEIISYTVVNYFGVAIMNKATPIITCITKDSV